MNPFKEVSPEAGMRVFERENAEGPPKRVAVREKDAAFFVWEPGNEKEVKARNGNGGDEKPRLPGWRKTRKPAPAEIKALMGAS